HGRPDRRRGKQWVLPRHGSHARVRRTEIRWHQRLSLRERTGTFPGPLRDSEFIQPTHRPHEAGRGRLEEMAAAGRRATAPVTLRSVQLFATYGNTYGPFGITATLALAPYSRKQSATAFSTVSAGST